jgi:hypothetical protein
MGLANVVRAGVAIADRLVKDLEVTVLHYPWISESGFGKPSFAVTPVPILAVVRHTRDIKRTVDGDTADPFAVILIPRPLAANGATGRDEPIDPRDKFVLPDGTEFVVRNVVGILDPSTGKPYAYRVEVG